MGSKGSYANVVSEKNTRSGVGVVKLMKDEKEVKRMVLKENDLVKMDDSAEVVLAKIREVEAMAKLYGILENEGFNGFEAHHVGGLWVWIEFNNQKACQRFKDKDSMKAYFSEITHVSRNFVVDEKLVWIEIDGLPLCAWSSEAFKKIGSLWGKFMFFEDDTRDNVSCRRVCIRTSLKHSISEMIQVEVTGVSYWVRVRETGIWSIKIEKDASASESDYRLDSSSENDCNDAEVEDSTSEIKVAKDDGKSEEKENEPDSAYSCKKTMVGEERESETLSRPPGFKNVIIESNKVSQDVDEANSNWIATMGHSGGIVSMWDTAVFVKSHIHCGVNYVIVAGKWMGVQGVCHVINVYAPQTVEARKRLWEEICHYMQSNIGHFIVFGDFNEVRHASERFGSVFNQQGANAFNEFINQTELVNLNIGGRNFTWMNKFGTKLSKLDRYLVSVSFTLAFPDILMIALDRKWSDHLPILLHSKRMDFRPIPFRVFHSWLDIDGFHDVVVQSYNDFDRDQEAACNYLKNKMKYLKGKIKDWHKDFKVAQTTRSKSLCSRIGAIEDKMDDMTATEEEVAQRIFWLKELADIERSEVIDAAQKSKIKWEVEGDENTTFFHGLLNQRRRKQMVQGIMEHGQWHTDPETIKNVFVDFYREKFDAVRTHMPALDRNRFTQLDNHDIEMLERPCSIEEVKATVWHCGSDKALGPDGFTFKFIKKYWDLMQHDIYNMVTTFCNEGKLPIGCNASFITLIPKVTNPVFVKDYRPISLIGFQYKIIAKMLAMRLTSVINNLISSEQSAFVKGMQILDGPLMVGEVMEWYKIKRKKLMIFKVDFEKAYDSLCWEYIDFVMIQFGFGTRWRNWIRECLITTRLSILINGSPTEEIPMFRGLRQGDLLSPFLFILAMEGLHIAIQKAMEDKKIANAIVGDTKLNISHLFYVDGVVFLTDWSHDEVDGILDVLHNFHVAMAITSRWDVVIQRFHNRLSKWKVKMLSSGGRLTLIKSVLGSLGIYLMSLFRVPEGVIKELEQLRARVFWGYQSNEKKIAWVAWDKVLTSKDRGGLGIAIHGDQGGVVSRYEQRTRSEDQPLWSRFNHLYMLETEKNCKVRDRWNDGGWVWKWRRDVRGGIEQNQLNTLLILIANIGLQNGQDKARWALDDQGIFSVAATRLHIDEMRLVGQDLVTRWCAFVPRKVNIFVWRVMLDRLPTRYNLSRRGLEIEAIFCPCCGSGMETISHVLFTCYLAKEVWSKIVQWCQVHMPEVRSFTDWASWCNQAPNVNNSRARLEVIGLTTCWMLWRYRNSVTFDSGRIFKRDLVDNVIMYSFFWLKHRNSKSKISWVDWLKHPLYL
ncbi:putative RNA-directed DNA polymerase, eukaryota, reverse transcriptase zinc-binding domain protein [Tanacetum coccineum]|uniref:RNA-directed DNA polymerase, eukaryota, reverse transcriptase zinc-binding domain protein n=1 Tax=Tanacetum coccineum TaxID=301880 RepID=A0ABQ4ZYP7_9ASTR